MDGDRECHTDDRADADDRVQVPVTDPGLDFEDLVQRRQQGATVSLDERLDRRDHGVTEQRGLRRHVPEQGPFGDTSADHADQPVAKLGVVGERSRDGRGGRLGEAEPLLDQAGGGHERPGRRHLTQPGVLYPAHRLGEPDEVSGGLSSAAGLLLGDLQLALAQGEVELDRDHALASGRLHALEDVLVSRGCTTPRAGTLAQP